VIRWTHSGESRPGTVGRDGAAWLPSRDLGTDGTRERQGAARPRLVLRELDRLGPEMPLLLEHLPSDEEYILAAEHIRSDARDCAIGL
jgi:hypothetical protein